MADAKEFEAVNPPPQTSNEKIEDSTAKHNEFEDTGRRQSVALNIVENPLKVGARRTRGSSHVLTVYQRKSPEHTASDAREWAEANGLQEHASLFARGAKVARDPERFEHITELEPDELAALQYERDHKWHGSKMLWYSISLCAIGAATQGWDQVGVIMRKQTHCC